LKKILHKVFRLLGCLTQKNKNSLCTFIVLFLENGTEQNNKILPLLGHTLLQKKSQHQKLFSFNLFVFRKNKKVQTVYWLLEGTMVYRLLGYFWGGCLYICLSFWLNAQKTFCSFSL